MRYLDVTHISVGVPGELRAAEEFYCWLFDLAVSWRQPCPVTLAPDASWEEFEARGARPEIVMLNDSAFRLAVTRGGGYHMPGPIEHVGLQVSVEQLVAIRARAREAGFRVVHQRGDELFDFVDRYRVQWELDTRSFADPRAIYEASRRREPIR